MASGQTSNLALNQWAAGDRVTRADFNGDNQKIDAAVGALRTADTTMQGSISTLQGSVSALQTAVAGKCSVIVGSYIGDDTTERFINLGVTPKAVYVCTSNGMTIDKNGYPHGGLALAGCPVGTSSGTLHGIEIVDGGFRVTYYNMTGPLYVNNANARYHYAAFY